MSAWSISSSGSGLSLRLPADAWADEIGINIGGKRHWLHCAANASLTWFYPHAKRGAKALDEIDILPRFKGVLCHDHLKPYHLQKVAVHLCPVQCVPSQRTGTSLRARSAIWANKVQELVLDINDAVESADGVFIPGRRGNSAETLPQALDGGRTLMPATG